jgi:SAM-dependent methyltransferase
VSTPPVDLVQRVVGTDDVEAYERSGYDLVDQLAELLERSGYELSQFRDIYDFGSGPGRLTRALRERQPEARLTATDIDEEAIAWLSENAPGIDARVNGWLPPLPFGDDVFDLVIVISVFTHLPADYQDAWLAELRRVTRPGGVVIATVHGESHWRQTWDVGFAAAPRRVRLRSKLLALQRRLRGFAHWRGDGWERVFPDYYHTSWHRPGYVKRHWSRWFDVVRHEEATVPGTHDFVVLSAP